MRTDLLIYGAGGHGRVVLDAALRIPTLRVIGLLDDHPALRGQRPLGDTSIFSEPRYPRYRVVAAIGDTRLRVAVTGRVEEAGLGSIAIVHPAACVAREVSMAEGVMVLSMAVICTSASIGAQVIINTGRSVSSRPPGRRSPRRASGARQHRRICATWLWNRRGRGCRSWGIGGDRRPAGAAVGGVPARLERRTSRVPIN